MKKKILTISTIIIIIGIGITFFNMFGQEIKFDFWNSGTNTGAKNQTRKFSFPITSSKETWSITLPKGEWYLEIPPGPTQAIIADCRAFTRTIGNTGLTTNTLVEYNSINEKVNSDGQKPTKIELDVSWKIPSDCKIRSNNLVILAKTR